MKVIIYSTVGKEFKVIDRDILIVRDIDDGANQNFESIYSISYFTIEQELKNCISNAKDYLIFESKLFSRRKVVVNFDTGDFFVESFENFDENKLIEEDFEKAIANWMV